MQEIKHENFNYVKFFQTNYGLGFKPTIPALNKKNIVIGALIAIVGLILMVSVHVVVGLIGLAVAAILIVPPILKKSKAKAYYDQWMAEFNRRSSTWCGEFDKAAQKVIDDQKLEERGMNYLGIEKKHLIEDENNGLSSFYIIGSNFEGGWRRTNGYYRTEYQEITWLYFGEQQLYIYRVKMSLIDPKNKKEESQEFFYKDIVSISIAQESVDVKGQGTDDDGKTKQVDNERFRIVVPGDKLSFAYTPTDYCSRRINAMKNTIREMKTTKKPQGPQGPQGQ